MEADKEQITLLQKAIDDWEQRGALSAEQATTLRNDLHLKKAARQPIAQYFFIVALSCILLAFASLFIDDKLLERFRHYFSLPNLVIALIAAIVGTAWLWYVHKKNQRFSTIVYEVYMTLGGLAMITALTYICKEIGFGKAYSTFLLLACCLMGFLGIRLRSLALWLAALAALMGWYATATTAYGTGNVFWGMNYPVRFTIFGALLLGWSLLQKRLNILPFSQRATYFIALLIFFTGLWGVSVFGNYADLDAWQQVRQTQVIGYAILLGIASVIALVLGIRYKDELARDMGILFLLINLYTRYFEFFWDTMNKGLFFLVLGVSFWFVGRYIEKRHRRTGESIKTV